MSRPPGPRTLQGLALIDAGYQLRTAAKMAGVADSTLVRARLAIGAPALPRGRPRKAVP